MALGEPSGVVLVLAPPRAAVGVEGSLATILVVDFILVDMIVGDPG